MEIGLHRDASGRAPHGRSNLSQIWPSIQDSGHGAGRQPAQAAAKGFREFGLTHHLLTEEGYSGLISLSNGSG